MLSQDSKAAIDKLSKDELLHEVHLGKRSRFQGEKHAYVQTRLSFIGDDERSVQREENVEQKRQELKLGKLNTWKSGVSN